MVGEFRVRFKYKMAIVGDCFLGRLQHRLGEFQIPIAVFVPGKFIQGIGDQVETVFGESGFYARTVQLKLRYKDFTTITRAHSLPVATQLDIEIFEQIRTLFRKHWRKGAQVRLLGVHASSFEEQAEQINLLEGDRQQRWKQALSAADRDPIGAAGL